MIDVPLSHIPVSVYDTSVEWLDKFSIGLLCAFVVWSLNRLLTILEPPQQGGHQRRTTSKFHVIMETILGIEILIFSYACLHQFFSYVCVVCM